MVLFDEFVSLLRFNMRVSPTKDIVEVRRNRTNEVRNVQEDIVLGFPERSSAMLRSCLRFR